MHLTFNYKSHNSEKKNWLQLIKRSQTRSYLFNCYTLLYLGRNKLPFSNNVKLDYLSECFILQEINWTSDSLEVKKYVETLVGNAVWRNFKQP